MTRQYKNTKGIKETDNPNRNMQRTTQTTNVCPLRWGFKQSSNKQKTNGQTRVKNKNKKNKTIYSRRSDK